jgi:hypothetical protein
MTLQTMSEEKIIIDKLSGDEMTKDKMRTK